MGYLHGVVMRATQSRLCAAAVPPPPYINSVTSRASAGQHCSSLQPAVETPRLTGPTDTPRNLPSQRPGGPAASAATISRAANLVLHGVAAEKDNDHQTKY